MKFKIASVSLTVITLTIGACFLHITTQIKENTFPDKESIDRFIETKMTRAGIVGISASIIVDKKVVWTNGYGYANREKKLPFTPATVINIASISKTFTGVCLMKAVEQGTVKLDEDINSYLPFKIVNPYFPNGKITLRHLATHTSGLVDRNSFYEDSTYVYGGNKPESLGGFLKNYFVKGGKYYSKSNFLMSRPGKNYVYSNISTGLAGYIVELATGQKLNEYSRQHIFEQLAMMNSGWSLSEVNTEIHSKLYRKQGDRIKEIQFYECPTYPANGVRTSVEDLSKYFICLLNDGELNEQRILSKELAKEMTRFQFTESKRPNNVKLNKLNSGIFWATKEDLTRIGHNGFDPGVRTYMLSDLNKEIAVVIFFNTELPQKERRGYSEIFRKLYNYGVELRKTSR